MAQETWALKLDPDLKEKVQEIIKNDFESSKEFMEQLVNMYELHQLKQGENVLTQEVEELEALTRRINGIFINANAKINTMLLDKDAKLGQQTELKQRLIEKLQGDLIKLEEEKESISAINDALVNSNNEYIEEFNQLTKSTSTLEALITEYREKNDTLTGLLKEYKEDREQMKLLQKENQELTLEIERNNTERAMQAQKISDLTTKIETLQETHENAFSAYKEHSDREVDLFNKKTEININLKVLGIREKHQEEIELLQYNHNQEIRKYKNLLNELEQKKSPQETALLEEAFVEYVPPKEKSFSNKKRL